MTSTRVCAYPACPVEFEPTKPWHRYHDRCCRMADWKRTAGYVDPRQAHRDRNASESEIRPRSGPQVSLRKGVASVHHSLEAPLMYAGMTSEGARELIEQALVEALPARQRERLEGRA